MDNLNSCLAYIGLHRPGLWWIDAICINQADTEEKNHQVALMRYIYEEASQVYAWLGGAGQDDWKVVRLFQRLDESLIQGQTEIGRCKIRWDNMNLYELNLEDVDSNVWLRLILFFGRAYFSRTWVLQELMFDKGRKNVIFGCGQLECHASAVWRSVQFLHSNEWIPAIYKRHRVLGDSNWDKCQKLDKHQGLGNLRDWHNVYMHTKIVSSLHVHGSLPLRTLILATAEFETREPRDKILALLGMTRRVRNVGAYGIKVDYSQPVEDLYRDITGCLTVKTQSYHLLALSQDPSNKRIPNLPSWVPDYSMPSLGREIGDLITQSHSLSAHGSITCSEGSATLGVKARISDDIEVVSRNAMSGLQARDLLDWLEILAKYWEVDIKVVLYRLLDDWNEDDLELNKPVNRLIYDILSLLSDSPYPIKECVGHFAGFIFQDPMIIRRSVVTGWEDIVHLVEYKRRWGFLGPSTLFQDHVKMLFTTHVHRLRLFMTKLGQVGLGPESIRKGDVLSEFDGQYDFNCLRPNGSDHYCLLSGRVFNCWPLKEGLRLFKDPKWQRIFLD